MRLLFYFAVLGYTYLFKPGGFLAGKGEGRGWGDELKNGVVFTWAFLEMLVWFWVSVSACFLLVMVGRRGVLWMGDADVWVGGG